MEFKFLDVIERDVDYIIMEEFVSSKQFANIFLSKIGLTDSQILLLEHSKTDVELGESDITVIVKNDDVKHGLLIENKIDVVAQPNQCQRYYDRGRLGIKNGDYSNFDVFIVAPEKYLMENDEAKKYPNRVLYEEMILYFENQNDIRSDFKVMQIRQAVKYQKTGYKVIEVQNVTDFWNKYIDYQCENHPQLMSLNSKGPKGAHSTWPMYKTVHKDVTIVHKLEKGYVDLTFRGGCMKTHLLMPLFEEIIGDFKAEGIIVTTAGKSAILRIKVTAVDVYEAFEKKEVEIEEGFRALDKLNDISLRLDVKRLQEIF